MARLRAGHARPLRGGVNGLRTRGAREGGSPVREPFARAKPAREASPSGEVAAKQAGRVQKANEWLTGNGLWR